MLLAVASSPTSSTLCLADWIFCSRRTTCAGEASPMAVVVSAARPPFRKLSKRVHFQGLTVELVSLSNKADSAQDLQGSSRAERPGMPAAIPGSPEVGIGPSPGHACKACHCCPPPPPFFADSCPPPRPHAYGYLQILWPKAPFRDF